MDAVPPGTYRLVVMPGGYRGRYLSMGYGALRANDAGRPLTIRAGEEIRDADVGVTTGFAIEGRVVDEAGEPLSRIPVFAARLFAGSDSAQRVSDLSMITDDLGRYRVYGLEPGTYIVGADGHVMPVMVFDGTVRSVWSGLRESNPFVTTYYPSATTEAAAQPVRVGGQDVSGIDITLRRAERFAVSGRSWTRKARRPRPASCSCAAGPRPCRISGSPACRIFRLRATPTAASVSRRRWKPAPIGCWSAAASGQGSLP